MRRLVLFPDTNIFLQCKTLHELPWAECFDVDHIDFLVGAPVQDEIDELKQNGNHRRARRARDANSLFRQALDSADQTIVIRERAPRVVLSFAPLLPPQRESAATLDLKRADDRLIDEVQHYRRCHDACAQILTGDTGMRLRARRHDVPVFAINDAWSLPPESDERDKEIRSLKTELTRFRDAEPALELTVHGADRKPAESISAVLPFYPALSAAELACFVDDVQLRYPKATDFGIEPPQRSAPGGPGEALRQSMRAWRPPTTEAIDEYRKAYDDWLAQARRRFERLDLVLNCYHRVVPLQLELRNGGSRPADEVLFAASLHAGLKFCISAGGETPKLIRHINRLEQGVTLVPPPEAPKGKYVSIALGHRFGEELFGPRVLGPESFVPRMPALTPPAFNRDRHQFYRQDDGSGSLVTKCSFSRSEFRHGADPQVFRLWIVAPPQIAPRRSHLHCTVSCRNLTKPLKVRIPIQLQYESRSSLEVANRWRLRSEKRTT